MRLDKVIPKALVVIALACLGWNSPTMADMPDLCDGWFCVETDGPFGCDDQIEIQNTCDQHCSGWSYYLCEDEEHPCDPEELFLYCHKPG